jgi:4-amino-4-deoxy-L-arabinose transferase-like glycosyltransferase
MTAVLAALSAAIATALVLSLFGVARDLLPATGWLALLLAAVHLAASVSRAPMRADWRTTLRAHAFEAGLVALCLLSLAVRLPNFASDLGHAPLDIDEHRFASTVKHFFVTGELLHDTVEHYPGLVFWLFSAASFISYLQSLIGGATTAIGAVPVETFVHACRLANVFVAAATVGLTGVIGRRFGGPPAGLVAAALVAISPLAVDVTVLVRNDPGMALAVVATAWAALVYVERGAAAWLIVAGSLAGVSAAIKYSAVFAIVPVLIAAGAGTPKGRRLHSGARALAAFVAAVAVTNHFIWADVPNFLRQLSDQVAITGRGHYAASDNPAAFYADTLIGMGVGWPLVLLAAGFAVHALSARQSRLWIVISFPLLYIWFMTGRPSQFPRWVYPMLPFVAVGGASALVHLVSWLRQRTSNWRLAPRQLRAVQVAAAVLLLIVVWQPVWAGVVSFSRRVTPPTHALAEGWIREHAPPGSPVLLEANWLDLSGSPVEVKRAPSLRAVLDAGLDQLAGCQLVVVQETLFKHPTLQRLNLMRRFEAGQSFGGNTGIDYGVYWIAKPSPGGPCGDVVR